MGGIDTALSSLPNMAAETTVTSPEATETGLSPATLISLLSIEKGFESPEPGGVCEGKQRKGDHWCSMRTSTLTSPQRMPASSSGGSRNAIIHRGWECRLAQDIKIHRCSSASYKISNIYIRSYAMFLGVVLLLLTDLLPDRLCEEVHAVLFGIFLCF